MCRSWAGRRHSGVQRISDAAAPQALGRIGKRPPELVAAARERSLVRPADVVGRVRGQRQGGRMRPCPAEQWSGNRFGILPAHGGASSAGGRCGFRPRTASDNHNSAQGLWAVPPHGPSRRRLHDEPLPKHVDPARLRPEGCGFLHYIHDVVVLKNIPGRVGVAREPFIKTARTRASRSATPKMSAVISRSVRIYILLFSLRPVNRPLQSRQSASRFRCLPA